MNQISTATQAYWVKVREVEATLPPVVHLVSIELPFNNEHKAGVMVMSNPYNAAQALVGGTHRRATEEEIKTFEADIVAAQERAKQAAIDAKGIHIHPTVVAPATTPEGKKNGK